MSFPVNVGLRQGCVSPWLFNVYFHVFFARGECKGAWIRARTAECNWWQV